MEASGLVYNDPNGSYLLADWMTYVITNVDTFWQKTYAAWGISDKFSSVMYYWVPETQDTVYADDTTGAHCRGSSLDTNPAYYCGADDTIIIYLAAAQALWDGVNFGTSSTRPGDFALAYAIAHEYGHNIEKELGFADRRMELLNSNTVSGPVLSKYYELFADCLAGVWANSAYFQGILEEGDIEEGLAEAYALGGDWYGGDLPEGWHGTREERQAALYYGYYYGSAYDCGQEYWTKPLT